MKIMDNFLSAVLRTWESTATVGDTSGMSRTDRIMIWENWKGLPQEDASKLLMSALGCPQDVYRNKWVGIPSKNDLSQVGHHGITSIADELNDNLTTGLIANITAPTDNGRH